MSTLDYYDLQLDNLADLVGDFDPRSVASTEDWIRAQWGRYARSLRFTDDLDRLIRGRRRSRVSINDAGLRAFNAHLSRRGSTARGDVARVRHQSIVALRRHDPSRTWLTDVTSALLPEGACVDSGEAVQRNNSIERMLGMATPAVQPRVQVFRSGDEDNFFFSRGAVQVGTVNGACNYTVRLSLGTFPFVYGDDLAEPVGMRWKNHQSWRPALEGMRVASGFWGKSGNLRQDARQVVEQYKHFRVTTARALRRKMPGARDATTGLLKPMDKRTRVPTARGPISVNGHNFVLLAFASFFAARRAYLRAPETFTPEAWQAARSNPDPVLREQLGIKRAI